MGWSCSVRRVRFPSVSAKQSACAKILRAPPRLSAPAHDRGDTGRHAIVKRRTARRQPQQLDRWPRWAFVEPNRSVYPRRERLACLRRLDQHQPARTTRRQAKTPDNGAARGLAPSSCQPVCIPGMYMAMTPYHTEYAKAIWAGLTWFARPVTQGDRPCDGFVLKLGLVLAIGGIVSLRVGLRWWRVPGRRRSLLGRRVAAGWGVLRRRGRRLRRV